jgi:preprotein translocase subunit SecF
VLSRTIVTGISTLIAVASLMFLGGEVIHDFAMALFLGIVIGTYSSIFVASPIVVEWERRAPSV